MLSEEKVFDLGATNPSHSFQQSSHFQADRQKKVTSSLECLRLQLPLGHPSQHALKKLSSRVAQAPLPAESKVTPETAPRQWSLEAVQCPMVSRTRRRAMDHQANPRR